jgi:taurine dioxygenase
MKVVPLSDTLGVELTDFDLKRELSPDEQRELREIFAEHHLIVIHADDVTDDDQTRFVANFGPVHVVSTGALETYVSNRPDRMMGTGTKALLWHNDGTYGARPGIATCLWAQEVSEDSSPTELINAVHVLDTLPKELRETIEPLHALHMKDTKSEPETRWREKDIPDDEASRERFVRHVHPIIYTMPHTHHETLFVNEMLTSHIVELPEEESEAILQELFDRLYAEQNSYSHVWRNDDIIIWDNLAVQHRRSLDMGTGPRHLRRQSLDGWFEPDGTLLDWSDTVVLPVGLNASGSGM